jgi:hypothetical protein
LNETPDRQQWDIILPANRLRPAISVNASLRSVQPMSGYSENHLAVATGTIREGHLNGRFPDIILGRVGSRRLHVFALQGQPAAIGQNRTFVFQNHPRTHLNMMPCVAAIFSNDT